MQVIEKNREVEKAVLELKKLNEDFKQYEEDYKEKKAKLQGFIKDYADRNSFDEFGINSKLGLFKVRPVINRKIVWDYAKLLESLGKKLYREVVDKTYSIADYDGFADYLKSCGADPKKVAPFLSVEQKVNDKKLNECAAMGDITEEQIKDCYKLELSLKYVNITEMER